MHYRKNLHIEIISTLQMCARVPSSFVRFHGRSEPFAWSHQFRLRKFSLNHVHNVHLTHHDIKRMLCYSLMNNFVPEPTPDQHLPHIQFDKIHSGTNLQFIPSLCPYHDWHETWTWFSILNFENKSYENVLGNFDQHSHVHFISS